MLSSLELDVLFNLVTNDREFWGLGICWLGIFASFSSIIIFMVLERLYDCQY